MGSRAVRSSTGGAVEGVGSCGTGGLRSGDASTSGEGVLVIGPRIGMSSSWGGYRCDRGLARALRCGSFSSRVRVVNKGCEEGSCIEARSVERIRGVMIGL